MTGKNNELTSQDRVTGEAPELRKKPYAKPRLSVYGNVEQITKGEPGGLQEGDQTGTSLSGEA